MATLIRSAQISSKSRLLNSGVPLTLKSVLEPVHGISAVKKTSVEQPVDNIEVLNSEPKVKSGIELELEAAQSRAVEATAKLDQLLLDIEAARLEASEQGRKSGYEDGIETGKLEFKEQMRSIQKLLENLSGKYASDIAQVEDAAVDVVFTAITKILGDQLVNPDGVSAAVQQAIQQVTHKSKLVIHLSPMDKELLEQSGQDYLNGILENGAEIVADDRISMGGCILEASGGSLDARLELQLQKLKDSLLEVASQRNQVKHG